MVVSVIVVMGVVVVFRIVASGWDRYIFVAFPQIAMQYSSSLFFQDSATTIRVGRLFLSFLSSLLSGLFGRRTSKRTERTG